MASAARAIQRLQCFKLFPSCAAMCSGTAVARGPLLVGYCTLVTHTHTRAYTQTREHTLCRLSLKCFTRNPEEEELGGWGGEVWQASDISISAGEDTTALKVSRCAASQIKGPQIYHTLYIKRSSMPGKQCRFVCIIGACRNKKTNKQKKRKTCLRCGFAFKVDNEKEKKGKVEGRGGGDSFWEVLAFGDQAHPSTTPDAKQGGSWPGSELMTSGQPPLPTSCRL